MTWLLLSTFLSPPAARAGGGVDVEIIAAYNLVVDSNVSSPSTYAPSVATVIGRFCNTSTQPITNVQGFIGDYTGNPVTSTPGEYPEFDSATLPTTHPLYNSGIYEFQHVGGRVGTADATRYMGSLAPGTCKTQYWHFTYPRCKNNPDGSADFPPCDSTPVWGDSVKPDDDLSLDFDVWSTSDSGTSTATWTMTMRNEISAMANKIRPNPDGRWFNTDANQIEPGDVITSNGMLYELGNINKGFDNDDDFVYDYNAWLQPIGDPGYDPSCFRLIRTSGVLTVARSGGNPDLYIPFQDQLYFTNLPSDNTGVRGIVRYTFLALDGPCSTALTPYQEVASGADNEKFNGDYGVGIPPIGSTAPQVTIDKSSNPASVAQGGTITYDIPFQNDGTKAAGLPLYSVPLVISDTVPAGTEYVSGSAAATVAGGATIHYSTDGGATWTTTEPSPASDVTTIQWWLNSELAPSASGSATFQVTVPTTYLATGGSPIVENTACSQFGSGVCFDEATATSVVQGNNSIGDFVWRDLNRNGLQDGGGETGIADITVNLYWDDNGNGTLDAGESLLATTSTNGSGTYSFPNLPDGRYVVQVDTLDPELPVGFAPTTPKSLAVALDPARTDPNPVNNSTTDFGFGPVLELDKVRTSPSPTFDGAQVTYSIFLRNTRPGAGTGPTSACTYRIPAGVTPPADATPTSYPSTNNRGWQNQPNILGLRDGLFASTDLTNNPDTIGLSGFNALATSDAITQVRLLIYAREVKELRDGDNLQYTIFFNNTASALTGTYRGDTFFTGPAGTDYLISAPLSRAWTWSDFSSNFTEVQLLGDKEGGSPGDIGVDAVILEVTTDGTCGSADETINPLPLTDTFDPARLQFVSASPAQTSVSGGTISWDNLGPLYAGQTKEIKVTFRAQDTAAQVSTDNVATVNSALFVNGRPVNPVSDTVPVTINPGFSIGDRVWLDLNGNRTDDSEPGLAGVRVTLEWEVSNNNYQAVATTTTDSTGFYQFAGLDPAQTYRVLVDTTSLPGGATGWTNTKDRDSGAANGNNNSGDITSPTATNVTDADFGYQRSSPIILGSIWNDWNNSGTTTPDTGEEGLQGVTVYLDDGVCGGASPPGSCPTAQTDASGNFIFTSGVSVNTAYTVRVLTSTLPGGAASWAQTFDTDGTGTPHAVTVTVPPAPSGTSFIGRADYSYRRTGTLSIGDTVYRDWNGDGTQGTGEEGISGVVVALYQDDNGNGVVDGTDALVATQTTDGTGGYNFTGLASGDYIVLVQSGVPGGHQQTQDPDEAGTCSTCDGRIGLTLSASRDDVDFGYRPVGTGSIGDTVFRDDDHDGTQDAGEPGIAAIIVRLYEDSDNNGVIDPATDALVATTQTNASGLYSFTNLPAGTYLVDVDEADTDLPTDSGTRPYVLTTGNDPLQVVLSAGQVYEDADFGFDAPSIIGDFIWQDNDGDGSQDLGEPGIPGVTVYLCLASPCTSGNAIATEVTDANGVYEFVNRPAGDYVVAIDPATLPPGYTLTYDPDGIGAPCTASCNNEAAVTLQAGQVDRSQDFGYQPSTFIGDYVWLDLNGDGVQDATEVGLPFVTVELLDGANSVIATDTTDGEGLYSFGGLTDGTYSVRVNTSTLPSGLSASYDPDSGTASPDSTSTLVILGGQVVSIGGTPCTGCDLALDFGYELGGPYSISGTVFFDDDNDGGLYTPATGDQPFEGIAVYLWNDQGQLIGTTETAPDGSYSFPNLPSGDYSVSVHATSPYLTGLALTEPTPNAYRTPVTIVSQPIIDQDFGFYGALDYGDLPSSYSATSLADQGARHRIGTLFLGSVVDLDANGQPTATADGDDTDGTNDDDGITPQNMNTWTTGTNGGTVDVTVTGGSGYLNGWVDWNNDGDFDDAGEQILVDRPVSAGSQTISFDIPGTATLDQTYNVRFRLYETSTNGNASPRGLVDNGEVEDYQWAFIVLGVELEALDATARGTDVLIQWTTTTEQDVLGFNVYRATSADGSPTPINGALIPSQSPGSGQGASYEWIDADVTVGTTYLYWIEDVDIDGTATRHGPVAATVQPPTAVALSTLASRPAHRDGGLLLLIGLASAGIIVWRRRR